MVATARNVVHGATRRLLRPVHPDGDGAAALHQPFRQPHRCFCVRRLPAPPAPLRRGALQTGRPMALQPLLGRGIPPPDVRIPRGGVRSRRPHRPSPPPLLAAAGPAVLHRANEKSDSLKAKIATDSPQDFLNVRHSKAPTAKFTRKRCTFA